MDQCLKSALLLNHFKNARRKAWHAHASWNNLPNKLTYGTPGANWTESRSGARPNLPLVNRTKHKHFLKKMKWEVGGNENFPISEANRLLSPSLADVRGWLLLFDGANLNIPPVPLDSCLLLSKCDNMEKEDCFQILWHPIMTFRGEKTICAEFFYSIHFCRAMCILLELGYIKHWRNSNIWAYCPPTALLQG